VRPVEAVGATSTYVVRAENVCLTHGRLLGSHRNPNIRAHVGPQGKSATSAGSSLPLTSASTAVSAAPIASHVALHREVVPSHAAVLAAGGKVRMSSHRAVDVVGDGLDVIRVDATVDAAQVVANESIGHRAVRLLPQPAVDQNLSTIDLIPGVSADVEASGPQPAAAGTVTVDVLLDALLCGEVHPVPGVGGVTVAAPAGVVLLAPVAGENGAVTSIERTHALTLPYSLPTAPQCAATISVTVVPPSPCSPMIPANGKPLHRHPTA